MKEFLQFAVLGLGLAAVYTLMAQGVVLIYRGSGVVNFAHGAVALLGAIIFVELRADDVPVPLALAAAVVAGVLVGVVIQTLIMRQLRRAAPIARVIATLGVLIVIQGAAALHYGVQLKVTPQWLPQDPIEVFGVSLSTDRVVLYCVGLAVTAALIFTQRHWVAAMATRASAENELAVATLGWSPGLLATINWALGCGLAALAGALIVPITGLIVPTITLLVVPALAAALLGKFDSFLITLLGATGIGVAQALVSRYWSQTGASDGLPFIVIIVVLVVTGRSLPLRSHITDRLPAIGSVVVRPVPVLIGVALAAFGMLTVFDLRWLGAFTVTFAISTIYLSLVVVTGYAGQISLAQYALAGLGAYVAGRLMAAEGWSFVAAAVVGVLAAAPIGALFALPALRTRGVNLSVVTLGMGVAVSSMLFNNTEYTGKFNGTNVGSIDVFGYDISRLDHPERYGIFVLLMFLVTALAVANLRRSAVGRRLIAIRENERAAAALGISVAGAKIYAFTVGSMIAALGGVLLAFQNSTIIYTDFDPFKSILAISYTVIGGIGYVLGAVFGSTFAPGGLGSLFSGLISSIEDYLVIIGGASVVLMLVAHPNGIAAAMEAAWRQGHGPVRPIKAVAQRVGSRRARRRTRSGEDAWALVETSLAQSERREQQGATLEVEGLTVRFGGVVAVNDVSLTVRPGEIVGLIGPNGAGKTTFIDAVSGFVHMSAGQVRVDGRSIVRDSTSRRVDAGVARSWQSLELFEDVTVLENLQIASETSNRRRRDLLLALLRPARPKLNAAAAAAVVEFELRRDLMRSPQDLPYGRRRLVGIARTVALNPRVLLLDEPAAGLSDQESRELGRLVSNLARSWGMGILLVEHDVDLVMSICDRVVVLDFGHKIAEGTPAEVRADPAVIEAYLGSTTVTEDALAPGLAVGELATDESAR